MLDYGAPDWVESLAQDLDGTWWGFEVEPNPHHQGWYENEVGRCIRLGARPRIRIGAHLCSDAHGPWTGSPHKHRTIR